MLKDVNYGRVIYLNDHAQFGQLDYIFYFLHYSHKAGDFKLCRPVNLLCRGEKPGKKDDWLDGVSGWPTSFRDDLAKGSMENHSSKAKFLGEV